MALRQVKSVAAGGSASVPCGTPFSTLLNGTLPATLNVTFDDDSVISLPISWLFGQYDPWDNIGRMVTLRGAIVLPQKITTNDYKNDNQVMASFNLTTTPLTGQLNPPVGTEDCFLNRPGQPTAN